METPYLNQVQIGAALHFGAPSMRCLANRIHHFTGQLDGEGRA